MQGVCALCFNVLFSGMEEAGMKVKIKMLTDILMAMVLLLLTAYQVTGEKFHEWLGVFIFLLFIIHNVLNIRWYRNLFKGKYQLLRIIRTLINFAVFISMLCLAYSGIVISRYVFNAIPINSGMALARVMHLSGSYWGLVLMSVHLGLHWSMITGMFRKLGEGRNLSVISWVMRLLALFIAGYGAFCFMQEDIPSYLFLKVEFAFIDYEKNPVLVLFQHMSIMVLWAILDYYSAKGIGKISKLKGEKNDEK